MIPNVPGRLRLLRDAPPPPLQTFIAPSRACPIALSVLWMPIPKLASELTERATAACSGSVLSEPRFAADVDGAIRFFLSGVLDQERRLNWKFMHLLSPSLEEPLEQLKDYENVLNDFDFNRIDSYPTLTSADVVVSRSPPSEEVLGTLLSTGTIGLGVYVGWSILPQEANPFLLLACVAGGIICISTAAGIGRALQDGIYERLYGLLKTLPESEKREDDK